VRRGYKYGFNGKENDSDGEWGRGLIQDYGFRLYNPAASRFLSVDPLRMKYPELTVYQFASNTPICAVDLDGLELSYYLEQGFKYIVGESNIEKSTTLRIINRVLEHSAALDPYAIADKIKKNPIGVLDAAIRVTNPVTNTYDAVKNGVESLKRAANGEPEAMVDVGVLALTYTLAFKGIANAPQSAPAKPATTTTAPVQNVVKFTFRGDSRNYEKMFEQGMNARGKSDNLYLHALDNTNPPSNFIPTSKSFKQAQSFNDQVFVIKPKGGRDLNTELGTKSPHPHEQEVAIPIRISPEDIRGVIHPHGQYSTLNPNYKPGVH
jgi:RHS repeat-associated protein